VSRLAAVIDHRVQVRGATAGIDHWGAGNAERIDIAAGQRRSWHRMAKHSAPDHTPSGCIKGIDKIALGCCDNEAASCTWRPPIQRLRINVALDHSIEFLSAMDRVCCAPIEVRNDVLAGAIRCAMIKGDGPVRKRGAESRRDDQY